MTAFLLSTLFAASGVFAVAVIAVGWGRYLPAVRSLRVERAACEPSREVRVRISEVGVRRSATVLRPRFTAAARRPSQPADLPAAA